MLSLDGKVSCSTIIIIKKKSENKSAKKGRKALNYRVLVAWFNKIF